MKHVVQSSFAGRRINVFSGGASKGEDAVFQDARDIRDGGGNGEFTPEAEGDADAGWVAYVVAER